MTSELEPHSNCHQPHLYGAKVANYRPFALALHSGEPYTLFCKSCTEPHGGGLNSFAIVISRKGATTAAAAGATTPLSELHIFHHKFAARPWQKLLCICARAVRRSAVGGRRRRRRLSHPYIHVYLCTRVFVCARECTYSRGSCKIKL